jgi:RNA polymerase sigma-70 factor (ECF subfamily)
MIEAAAFQSLRPYLFSVAYRMLGSAADAEDVVQDAWLRAASSPDAVLSTRAWLTTVVTRLCLDRLKSARANREEYVGTWLPEPVLTHAVETGEDIAARKESVTMAFLVLLESLTPAERAAFVLREIFDRDYAEIAETLDTTASAVRQLVHRAKQHVASGRPRFVVAPERQAAIVGAFFNALHAGDLAGLQQHLAADVIYAADGGGKASAALVPVVGITAVAALMLGLRRRATGAARGEWRTEPASINSESAMMVYLDGQLHSVLVCSTDSNRITEIRVIRNPDKLVWLKARHTPSRG